VNDDCDTAATGDERVRPAALVVAKLLVLKVCDGRRVEVGDKAETEGDLKPESL
jgi:hypothetical protein